MKAVTLANHRPSRRADGLFWTQAKIEGADAPDASAWEVIADDVALDPLDTEINGEPALRSFTVQTEKAWVRLTFVDANGGEDDAVLVSTSPHPFRPTVAEISEVLRARTYSGKEVDPDNPMAALAGGKLLGDFGEKTTPTAAQVERHITTCCRDVRSDTGPVPGEMLGDARRVAALKTAAEIERSYIPEQTDEGRTIYQTLRITAAEELQSLVANLRLWTFANRGVA